MSPRSPTLVLELDGKRWSVGAEGYDLSIAQGFRSNQPSFFGVAAASAQVVSAGAFVGSVRDGGSCNCSTYTITPHCNGTHTECAGHVLATALDVREVCAQPLCVALLITVRALPAESTDESTHPPPQPGDLLLTRSVIEAAVRSQGMQHFRALAIRTLPNEIGKSSRNYSQEPAPFFTAEAMHWIVQQDIEHLIVDLPSVDRAEDQGALSAHRIFWNIPAGAAEFVSDSRRSATITEMAFIGDEVADGVYLLNLQVAPFATDAAPSRPLLLPLQPL